MILAYDIDNEVDIIEPIRPPDLIYAPKPTMRRTTRPRACQAPRRKRFAVKAVKIRGSRRATRQQPPHIVQARRRRLKGKQPKDHAFTDAHRKAHAHRHQPWARSFADDMHILGRTTGSILYGIERVTEFEKLTV